VIELVHHLFAQLALPASLAMTAGKPSVASHKMGKALLCKQDQHHLTLLQVLFSFVDYDDICRRLQSRQLQPSLLGSSALIPYATLTSLR